MKFKKRRSIVSTNRNFGFFSLKQKRHILNRRRNKGRKHLVAAYK